MNINNSININNKMTFPYPNAEPNFTHLAA